MKKVLFALLFSVFLTPVFSQNNAPVAINDTVRPVIGFPFEVNLLKNDYDPDGDSLFIPSFELFRINDSTWRIYPEYYIFPESYDSVKEMKYILKDLHGAASLGHIVIIRRGTPQYDFLDINNVKALISPFGNHFWDGENSRFEAPKGSGKNPIFNNTLWIGGTNSAGQSNFAGEYFRQVGTDFFMGPVSTSYDTNFPLIWNRVWKLDKQQIIFHRNHWSDQGYEPIESIASWPAHGNTVYEQSHYIAPFYDFNLDGNYDPFSGDYPLIRGDQAVFFVLNDAKEPHTESNGTPLGVEIHAMAYAFDKPLDSALNNMVFMHYDILNRSANIYDSTYLGLFSYFGLGANSDNYLGCDVEAGMFYAYNSDSIDGNSEPFAYGEHPPAIGVKIIGGPYLEPDNTDNTPGLCDEGINGLNFGDLIADNERLGLCNFIYGWPENSEGISSHYLYQAMKGYTNMLNPYMFGDSLTYFPGYGGPYIISTGGSGPACKYFFPGNSDTVCNYGTFGLPPNGGYNQNGFYWTEKNCGNQPGGRNSLGSTGPFTFEPGKKIPLDYCFLWARDYQGDHLSSVDLLRERIKNLYPEWNNLIGLPASSTSKPELPEINFLTIFPNPTAHQITLMLNNSEAAPYIMYKMDGKTVSSGWIKPGRNIIDLSIVNSGIYLLRCGLKTYKIVKL